MKKLIAIAVVFALIASAAFAEEHIDGQLVVTGGFISGNNVEKSHPQAGAIGIDNDNSRVRFKIGDDAAGARFRVRTVPVFDEWFGWWKPIPQLRIQFGANQDGDFGTAQISGWGFTAGAKSSGMAAFNEYGDNLMLGFTRTTGWYGGVSSTNLQFSIFPADGLTINLWFPGAGSSFAERIVKFNAQVKYNIEGIGTATVSYASDTGYLPAVADEWWSGTRNGTPQVWGSFFLTAIEGIAVDLGLSYHFPLVVNLKDFGGVEGVNQTTTTNYPFEIGIGFRYSSGGDFNFKLRSSISLGSSTVVETTGLDTVTSKGDVTQIAVNILPSYKLGNITAFFYAGLGIKAVNDWKDTAIGTPFRTNESNAVVCWFINPYVQIPAGAVTFFTGFQLSSTGVKSNLGGGNTGMPLNWGIPFGLSASF